MHPAGLSQASEAFGKLVKQLDDGLHHGSLQQSVLPRAVVYRRMRRNFGIL